jgi:hypothetical protein
MILGWLTDLARETTSFQHKISRALAPPRDPSAGTLPIALEVDRAKRGAASSEMR